MAFYHLLAGKNPCSVQLNTKSVLYPQGLVLFSSVPNNYSKQNYNKNDKKYNKVKKNLPIDKPGINGLICQNFEPGHELTNNVVCVTSKGLDQPLIRAFASCLNIL